jgi:hypothetical protein
MQLFTSWLETTEDGRKGTDQTGDVFWTTIAKHYCKKISNPKQSAKSLKNCWSIIQQAFNKFHGCVQQINHQNPSCTSSSNRNTMAHSLYNKLQGKPFPYTCCYNILRKSAKWHNYNLCLEKKNEPKSTSTAVPSSPTPGSMPSSAPVTVNVDLDGSGNETLRAPPEHPIGKKKLKAAIYQEQQLEASNHEHLKKMASAHSEIAIIAKKQQETLDAQNVNLQRLADEAIMNKDLTRASNMVKKFYKIEQKKILACLEAELEKEAK